MATTKKTATKTAKAAPKKVACKSCAKKACASKTCAKKCAKKDEKRKFIIFGLVLTLVLLGSSLGVMTWAAYQTSYESTSKSVGVAKWKIVLKDSNGTVKTSFSDALTFTAEESANVANGKIAPGISASGSFKIDLAETEVATDLKFRIKASDKTVADNAVFTASATNPSGVTSLACADGTGTDAGYIVCSGTINLPKDSNNKPTAFTAENGIFSVNINLSWKSHDSYVAADASSVDTTDGEAAGTYTFEVEGTATQHVE